MLFNCSNILPASKPTATFKYFLSLHSSKMTIDQLLRGVRSLVLSTALAYSACGCSRDCENNSDCREPRVCRQGECIDSNEGEAEGGGEMIPWYEGMCEELLSSCPHPYGEGPIRKEGCEFLCDSKVGELLKPNAESRMNHPPPLNNYFTCCRLYCINMAVRAVGDRGCKIRDAEHIDKYNEKMRNCMSRFGYVINVPGKGTTGKDGCSIKDVYHCLPSR